MERQYDKEGLIYEVVDMIVKSSDEKLQAMIDFATREGSLYMRDVLLMEQHHRIEARKNR